MAEFRRVLSVSELPPGGGMPVQIDGRTIALFNLEGTFYAIDNRCPHRGGSLADGALIGTTVVCPLHRWNFDLASGLNAASPGICVEKFPVEIRGDEVFVGLPGSTP